MVTTVLDLRLQLVLASVPVGSSFSLSRDALAGRMPIHHPRARPHRCAFRSDVQPLFPGWHHHRGKIALPSHGWMVAYRRWTRQPLYSPAHFPSCLDSGSCLSNGLHHQLEHPHVRTGSRLPFLFRKGTPSIGTEA